MTDQEILKKAFELVIKEKEIKDFELLNVEISQQKNPYFICSIQFHVVMDSPFVMNKWRTPEWGGHLCFKKGGYNKPANLPPEIELDSDSLIVFKIACYVGWGYQDLLKNYLDY